MKRSFILILTILFLTIISLPLLATDPDIPMSEVPTTELGTETNDSVEKPFWERLLSGNPEDSIATYAVMAAAASDEFAPPMALKMLVSAPSPEASEMIKHQEEEIDHATGTGRLTIPLFTLTSGDLAVPLSLQHRIGGFKADEKGGWVGLGWHLSGGGCVTRRIVGMPDELVPFDITTSTRLGNVDRTESDIDYLMDLQDLRKDASHDRYSYTCPGSSGEFIIKDGTIIPLTNNGDAIAFTGSIVDKVRDFMVTTPDGTKYFFTEREHVTQQPILTTLTRHLAPAYDNVVSTWHLTKIQSVSGGETITYSYTTLANWSRWTYARSATHTVSWYVEKTTYTGPQHDLLPSGTTTRFLDQKVLSKISSRMGDITFTSEAKSSAIEDTPSRLSKIVVSSKDGVNVREIRFSGEGQLGSCNIYADNVLVEGHTFTYNPGYSQTSTDFFGYCNGRPSNKHIVIDANTGKISDDLKYDLYYCKARSMNTHVTAMGLTTTYEYEPATVRCVRKNGETTENIDFQIGLRIKSLTYEDASTGRKKIRRFNYSKGISNIDFGAIGVWAFISLTGERTPNPTQPGETTAVRGVAFLDSSKIPGYRLEDALPYYGYVEELWEGTGITTPVKTTYTFDTSHCVMGYEPMLSGKFDVGYGVTERPLAMPNAFFPSNTPQKVCDAIRTGSLTKLSIVEKIGFGPLRTGVTSMTYEGGKYKALSKDTCFYTRIDSTRTMTGFYQEYAVCQDIGNGGIARRAYKSVNDFRYGNTYVCSGTFLLDSVASRTYFSDGSSRLATTRYLYSSKVPPMVIEKYSSSGGSIGGRLVPDPSPFHSDTITRKISFPVLTGTRERTGGHIREHYTAIAENITSAFFKKVVASGQRTLPVLEMYVIDKDTIIQSYQYGLFSNTYRPTALILTTNNGVVMDWQRINGYTSYGHPTGVRSMKNPNETYTWGGGGDLLTKITVTGGSLSQSTSFTYKPLVGCTSITSPDGSKISYTYKAGRLASATNPSGVVVSKYEYGLKSVAGFNRISTLSRVNDAGTGTGTFSEQAVYYDGFGEGCLTLLKGYGGSGQDVGTVTRFDALGRPLTTWNPLPITSVKDALSGDTPLTDASNSLYSNDSKAYIACAYPTSAESYAKQTRLQGADFSQHPATAKIVCSRTDNAVLKVIRYSVVNSQLTASGYYANGELSCLQETDGNGHSTYTFTDVLGRTVLVRRQGDDSTYSDTYTVSDNWGQPLITLPPEVSARLTSASGQWSLDNSTLANYAFIMSYDAMHRLRTEKLPGCAKKEYVYDSKSRLAYSRDGVHAASGECTFYLYDSLSRLVVTGICQSSQLGGIWDETKSLSAPFSEVALKSKVGADILNTGYQFLATAPFTISSARLLTATYYDNYTFLPTSWTSQASGTLSNAATSTASYVTGRLNAVLSSTDNTSLLTVNTYAKGGILLREESETQTSNHQVITYTPSVTGLPLTIAEQLGTHKVTTTNTYDRFGRLQGSSLESSLSTSKINLVTNSYSSIGQIQKETAQGSYQRTITIDIRGKVKGWAACGIAQNLLYGSSGKKSDWAGRVTAKITTYPNLNHRYDFTYNTLGFLIDAAFTSATSSTENFSTSYAYDKQANLQSIKRNGKLVGGAYGCILDATFVRAGNIVKTITAKSLVANPLEGQSGVSNKTAKPTYDVNGNLKSDLTRTISRIDYNDIDRPSAVYFSNGDRINYVYSASGYKFSEKYYSADKTVSRVRQLIGSFELLNGTLDRIQAGSGYLTSQGTYNIFIPDYQGNVVGVYDTSQKKLVQTTDYYPYGLPMITSTGAEVNRRKFGGKEYSTEFGLNESDFEARRFVPVWGGFSQPDPKAIDYPQFSPWAYCAGDPVNYIDINGEKPSPAESACMAAHIYGDMTDAILIGGWTKSADNLGLTLDNSHGLKSAVYVRLDSKGNPLEYAYVTAGTEMEWADIVADISQPFGLSQQHAIAVDNANIIDSYIKKLDSESKRGNSQKTELTFIGHSLGGSHAALNAIITNRSAITFNPAGVSNITKVREGSLLTPLKSEREINAYIMTTDPLNFLQDRLPIPAANGKRFYLTPTDLPSIYDGHSIDNILKCFGVNPDLYKIKK